MGLLSKETSAATLNKRPSEYSDSELLKLIDSPKSIRIKAELIKEASRRGLTNPKTGKKFQ